MIESDDQTGFFMAKIIPSPPHQTSVWFHKKEGKTTVSSLVIIPIMFYYLLSYPFHILYGKKRVKKRCDHGTTIFSSPPILLFRPQVSFLTTTCNLELIKNV